MVCSVPASVHCRIHIARPGQLSENKLHGCVKNQEIVCLVVFLVLLRISITKSERRLDDFLSSLSSSKYTILLQFSLLAEDWCNCDLFFLCLDTQLFISGYRTCVNLAKEQLAKIKVMVSASDQSTLHYTS